MYLQTSAPYNKLAKLLHSMIHSLNDIITWPTANALKLQDNKMEGILIRQKRTKHFVTYLLQSLMVMLKLLKQSVRKFTLTLDCILLRMTKPLPLPKHCYSDMSHPASNCTDIPTDKMASSYMLSRIECSHPAWLGLTRRAISKVRSTSQVVCPIIALPYVTRYVAGKAITFPQLFLQSTHNSSSHATAHSKTTVSDHFFSSASL